MLGGGVGLSHFKFDFSGISDAPQCFWTDLHGKRLISSTIKVHIHFQLSLNQWKSKNMYRVFSNKHYKLFSIFRGGQRSIKMGRMTKNMPWPGRKSTLPWKMRLVE